MLQLADAVKQKQLVLVYITDSTAEELPRMEAALFKNEELGIAMKIFRRIKIDVAKDTVAKTIWADKVPTFITYDAKGKQVDEVHMQGFKAKAGDVMKILAKASKGHGDLPVKTFVKKYREFLNKLDQVEGKKGTLQQKIARAKESGGRKLDKLEAEGKVLAKAEEKLLEEEKKILTAAKAFDSVPTAKDTAAVAAKPGGS